MRHHDLQATNDCPFQEPSGTEPVGFRGLGFRDLWVPRFLAYAPRCRKGIYGSFLCLGVLTVRSPKPAEVKDLAGDLREMLRLPRSESFIVIAITLKN